ncbi:unnamed protein product [Caenorhabditis brenneri]
MQPNGVFPWGSDPEDGDLLNFIVEKAKNVKSPIPMKQLATEFTTQRKCPRRLAFFNCRIAAFHEALNKLETFDRETKIKIHFLMSVSVNKKFLKTVRMDALVEVDEHSRITKYIANDGSLNLEGEHTKPKKEPLLPDPPKREPEEVPYYPSKRPRIDNWQPQNYPPFQGYPWMPGYPPMAPNHPGFRFWGPAPNYPGYFGPFEHFHRAPYQNYPMSGSIRSHPVLREPEDVKPKFTCKIKFLEAIKSLVISLDTPSLSRIRLQIQRKIWKIGESNSGISNDEMVQAMDLFVARIANHSVFDVPEYVESVSFKEFLCYLKAAILNSKLEGLEGLLQRIREKNKETAVMDRRIPMENVVSVLQHTLDFIWFYLLC